MPRKPSGLESQANPLKHRFRYSFPLSGADEDNNSAWVTLVRSVKGTSQNSPAGILVNPHHTSVVLETGAVCAQMSIIENLRLVITLNKATTTNAVNPIKGWWRPFFCSFPEKYDAADDDTGTTVAAIMALTKDDTEEDVVPLTTNKLPVDGNSERFHPVSTVNLAEGITQLGMTTDLSMEDAVFNNDAFQQILAHGTNKGALKACLGQARHFTLDNLNRLTKTYFIKKFVPRNIRRIVPFTYFGLLFHIPLDTQEASYYQDAALTGSKAHVGIKVSIRYDEWNEEHDNTHSAP